MQCPIDPKRNGRRSHLLLHAAATSALPSLAPKTAVLPEGAEDMSL